MRRDVWITGIGLVSSLGEGTDAHWQALAERTPQPVIEVMPTSLLPIHPLVKLELDKQIPGAPTSARWRAWQRLGTYSAGLALSDAGIAGKPEILTHTHVVCAADGGERDIAADSAILETLRDTENPLPVLNQRLDADLRPTLFLAQLPNLVAGNISIVHNVTGSSRTFMGEDIAGVSAVEIAWRRIAAGQGDIFLVGGANLAGRKDIALGNSLGGTLWTGDFAPVWQRPGRGGGAILGSVGAFLVLEAREHAEARGKEPYAMMAGVRSEMSRRRPGDIARTLGQAFDALVAKGAPVNAISAASGVRQSTEEEHGMFAGLIADGRVATVRGIASMIGSAVSGTFPASTALAALAIKRGGFYRPFEVDAVETPAAASPASIVVTAVGVSTGEGMGLISPVR